MCVSAPLLSAMESQQRNLTCSSVFQHCSFSKKHGILHGDFGNAYARLKHGPSHQRCPHLSHQPYSSFKPRAQILGYEPLNPTPKILNPIPKALNPEPSSLNPNPSSLNTTPKILNPIPKALNPKPYTLDPNEPQTLNPKPYINPTS